MSLRRNLRPGHEVEDERMEAVMMRRIIMEQNGGAVAMEIIFVEQNGEPVMTEHNIYEAEWRDCDD